MSTAAVVFAGLALVLVGSAMDPTFRVDSAYDPVWWVGTLLMVVGAWRMAWEAR